MEDRTPQRRFLQERGRTAKPQYWCIERLSDEVRVDWGQTGGKNQTTTQRFETLNEGKKNEKPPEQVAQEWMDRQILLRVRKGYVEVDPETDKPLKKQPTSEKVVQGDTIDFLRLPQNLRFYKPQNSMNKYCEKLIDAGKAWFVRKRNGNMVVISYDSEGTPRMYSSTLAPCPKDEPGIPWLDRFPHLKVELMELGAPPNTIFLCEMVADPAKDDLEYVGSVLRALTPKALDTQDEHGPTALCIWDIAFEDGAQLVGKVSYRERREVLETYVYQGQDVVPFNHITAPEIVTGVTAAEALAHAIDNDWEGYVVVDPESSYGDRGFNFSGKAERPKEACKLKPKFENDFIVRWDPDNRIGTRGKGKKSVGVGAVFAYLLNDKGEEVFISKVGGGLTDDNVLRFADPSLYPMVWEVEFASVTAKGSLEFPQFVRVRDDKPMEECTLDTMVEPRRKV